jgi:uncharacterized protein (DUF2147 family)
MRRFLCVAAIISVSAGAMAAVAPDLSPLGDWLVRDGYANIRIDNCGGKLWGIVAWEKEPGKDTENPDPAKKNRPTLGIPILMGLTPTKPNKWEGEIYNSQNGKMYSANVSVIDENTLELEGCLYPNFLCLAQKWTRVRTPPPNALPLPPVKGAAAPPAKGGKKGGAPAQSDVCVRVAEEAAALEKANASAKK